MYTSVLLACMCMCTTCVPGAFGGQKVVFDALALELLMAVGHYVGVGN